MERFLKDACFSGHRKTLGGIDLEKNLDLALVGRLDGPGGMRFHPPGSPDEVPLPGGRSEPKSPGQVSAAYFSAQLDPRSSPGWIPLVAGRAPKFGQPAV